MKTYHLPLKYELQKRTATYHHEELPPFKDLRECSLDFQKFFDGAWKVRLIPMLHNYCSYAGKINTHYRPLNEEV